MSLLGKASIIKMYNKKLKKSIRLGDDDRKDLFLVLVIVILISVPVIVNLTSKKESAAASQVILNYSARFEEIFGKELTEKLIQEFEEQNPDIRLLPEDDTTEPDILFFDEGSFNALAAGNALTELNFFAGYGDSDAPKLAITLVSFMDLLFYNTDILTNAGFVRPPRTRDEFTAYTRAVSGADSGAAGAAISLGRNDHRALSRDIFSWIWAAGGNFWTDGESSPSLDTRAVISDLTFLGTLYRNNLLAPAVFETTGDQRLEQFAQGRAAMMIASAQAIPYLREKMGDGGFGITAIPDPGTGGLYRINLSSIYAAISADSEFPVEAWSFLEFIEKKTSILCTELKAIPGQVSNIIPGSFVTNDSFYSKAWDIFESARITEGFSGKPDALKYESIFLEELRTFFEGSKTAQQAVTAINQRWAEVP